MSRLLRYAVQCRVLLALALVLGLLGTAAGLAQPRVVQAILEAIGAGEAVGGRLILLVGLIAAASALAGASLWLVEVAGELVVLTARRDLGDRLTRLRIEELDRHPPAELVSRATADVALLKRATTSAPVELVTGTVGAVGTVVAMVLLDVRLAVVTVAAVAATSALVVGVLPRLRRATTTAQAAVGELGAALDRALGAARTVKAAGAERRESAAAARAALAAYRGGTRAAKFTAIGGVGTALAFHLPVLVVLGAGGVLVARGEIGVPALTAFLLYVFFLAEPVSSLALAAMSTQAGLAAVDRLEGVLDLSVESDLERAGPRGVGWGAVPSVRFRDIGFGYAGRPPTLRGVSFDAVPGGLTVLVGASGAGKSSVLSLLLRFHDPDSGRIEVGGRGLDELSRALVRSQVGYVEQDAPVLHGTLLDNLTYAAGRADPAAVADVLRATRLDDLVARLPEGLTTAVGPRGVQLSGGERQRLAIARALLAKPSLLLLDEATSQLDAANDQALRETVAGLRGRCTVLAVAHREGLVADADRVVLLDEGRVRAVGTATELAEDAVFRMLFASSPVGSGRPHALAPV